MSCSSGNTSRRKVYNNNQFKTSEIIPEGGNTFQTSNSFFNEERLRSILDVLKQHASTNISELPSDVVDKYNELVEFVKTWSNTPNKQIMDIVTSYFSGTYVVGTIGASLSKCVDNNGMPGGCTLECQESVFRNQASCDMNVLKLSKGELTFIVKNDNSTSAYLIAESSVSRDVYNNLKQLGITSVKIVKLKNGKYIVSKKTIDIISKTGPCGNYYYWGFGLLVLILVLVLIGGGAYLTLKSS